MKKFVEKDVAENPLYHDTWKLLKKYRDVVWSLEISVQHVRAKFEIEYGTSIEEFLDSVYLAGADLNGSDIEHHAKCIERSHKMLKLLDSAVELLRTRHKNGEAYYWLLYYSFLSPQQLKNVEEIIENLRPHIRDISFRTYYRKRPLTPSVRCCGATPPRTVWMCWSSSSRSQKPPKKRRANNWHTSGLKLAHCCP